MKESCGALHGPEVGGQRSEVRVEKSGLRSLRSKVRNRYGVEEIGNSRRDEMVKGKSKCISE